MTLNAFKILHIATVSIIMSVHPSAWNNCAPTGWIFMKFDIREFFKYLSRKFKFDQGLTRLMYIYDNISLNCS